MAFPESNSTFSLLWFSEPNLWSITRIQFHLLRQVKCGQESWMQTSLGSVDSRWYSSLYNTATVQCTGAAGFQTLQFRQEDSAEGHRMLDSLSLHGVSECGCSSQGIFERTDWKQILRVRMYSVTNLNQVCFRNFVLAFQFVTSDVRVEKEILVYPGLSFVAEFGGSLGLFLGFSLLGLWDWLGLDCLINKIRNIKLQNLWVIKFPVEYVCIWYWRNYVHPFFWRMHYVILKVWSSVWNFFCKCCCIKS